MAFVICTQDFLGKDSKEHSWNILLDTNRVCTILKEDGLFETNKDWLSGVPDYFGRNKISSGGDLSHYSSASLY